ncbi:TolC family protein [Sphingobacterium spiritivorum]|uniref:TolC family protein n=1 Tax=Sphingobacterium spiritivorum TaxID=258 RepID=UPI003DA4AD13
MHYRYIVSVLYFLLGSGFAALGQVRDLQSCISQALQHNLAVQNSEIKEQRSSIAYTRSWQERLPTLNARLGHGINEGKSIDPSTNQFISKRFTSGNQELTTSMVLFDGLGMLYDIRQQSKRWAADQKDQEGALIALKLDVILAYIQVLTAKDILQQAEVNIETTRAQLQRSETLHKQGAIAPGDYFDIKGQYAAESSSINGLKKTLFDRRIALSGLMNIAESQLGELAPLEGQTNDMDVWTADAEQLYQEAQDKLPDFQSLQFKADAAEYAVKYAKSAYYPRLTFGAGLNSQYAGTSSDSYLRQIDNNLGKYISFGLHIPIFNGFKVRNQVKLARLDQRSQQVENDQKRLELRQNTSRAVFEYKQSYENIALLKSQVTDYKESFRIAQVRFDEGDINSVTYIIAKNKYEQSLSQLTVLQYQAILQQYTLDYYQGKLGF